MSSSFLRRLEEYDSSMATRTPPSNNHSQSTTAQNAARFSQIMEERDHAKCTANNHEELLKAKLSHLKTNLTQQIQDDDWMYQFQRNAAPSLPPAPSRLPTKRW